MFGLFCSKKKKHQPELVTDEVLGEIFYENSMWYSSVDFILFGKTYRIDIKMFSQNEEPVTAAQKESYKKIINNEIIAREIEEVLHKEVPPEEYQCLEYKPEYLCFRPNGDCALIVYIGEKDEDEYLEYAVTIFPEISYFGDEESYMSMVYFT